MIRHATAADGAQLGWRQDGPAGAPALLLLNSLGTTMAMWDGVLPALAARFRVIRMDTRGHGRSAAARATGGMGQLAADAACVLDAAGAAQARVCGVSLGGMVGLQLALDAPGRVALLAACNTTAFIDPAAWVQRAATVRGPGLAAIADLAMERFFSAAARAAACGDPGPAGSRPRPRRRG
jgi:3-oxoadipate enol-lactonase/4-carboxymuconolactone decarboxylase